MVLGLSVVVRKGASANIASDVEPREAEVAAVAELRPNRRRWAGRVCTVTGEPELEGPNGRSQGCPSHLGSLACLRGARELWVTLERERQEAKNWDSSRGRALELLDEFDRSASAQVEMERTGPWAYAGSPFERRVVAFLVEVGKRLKM